MLRRNFFFSLTYVSFYNVSFPMHSTNNTNNAVITPLLCILFYVGVVVSVGPMAMLLVGKNVLFQDYLQYRHTYLTNGFSHHYNWMSPLSLLGLIFIFYEISLCKQNSPRWDGPFCGVTSGAILFAYVPQKGWTPAF